MEKNTTIQISERTKKRLRKFEQHKRETHEEIIIRLLDDLEKIYSNKGGERK